MEGLTLQSPPRLHLPFFSTRLLVLIMHEMEGAFGNFRLRRFFRRRFVSLSTFSSAEALRRCLTSSRRSLCRCRGFGREVGLAGRFWSLVGRFWSLVGRFWRGRVGGLEGLRVGEDMQLRERVSVHETVNNNTI